jgi:hypothetical protein
MLNKDFRNLYILFLVILLLVPVGFRKYFSRLLQLHETSLLIHLHALSMSIWCILLLVQPILIIYKKRSLHKRIGKFTIWLMPFLLVFMYLTVGMPLTSGYSTDVVANIFMPFAHMIIFLSFYILAIQNKNRREVHLRYIVISSMSLLGPTIGRINFGFLSDIKGGFELLVIDLILLFFLLIDINKKLNIMPFLLGFILYLIVHVLSMTFAYSATWQKISMVLYPYI